MVESFNELNIKIINDFYDRDNFDIYLLVKELFYKDMYMTLYKDSFKDIHDSISYDELLLIAHETYIRQNKLNKSLKIYSGNKIDTYLIGCIVNEIYKRYPNIECLKHIDSEKFKNDLIDSNKEEINEYDVNYLVSSLKNKFKDKQITVDDVIKYIEHIDNDLDIHHESLSDYINYLIDRSNISLNQLGKITGIKKGIYDITLCVNPSKNHLIMLAFGLKLNNEEFDKLMSLAIDNVRKSSISNMYYFDKTNDRDRTILYWFDHIDELDKLSKKNNKYIIEMLNQILSYSGYELLK